MTGEKIWVVEDEEDIMALVYYNLAKEGFVARGFASGEEMLAACKKERPDIFLLDIMLPGIDGLTICARLKQDPQSKALPVVMLTARGEEADVVAGLNLGADDYIPKPFSPKLLVARVKAVLRRHKHKPPEPLARQLVVGDLEINLDRHDVRIAGRSIPLTATEYRIITTLAAKPGWVFSRDQIISAVHDGEIVVTDRTVDVQIVSLRKKLGPQQQCIETVRGIGYRFGT